MVLRLPQGTEVEHRDRNGLNNQKNNLRTASNSQQSANHGLHRTNTSGFKGVSKNGATVWKAMIKVFGKDIYLGTFQDKREAAKAYDKAAVQYFGEFARTNEMMGLL